jgi:uncharacterized membrane protein YidH (DUF202 family)
MPSQLISQPSSRRAFADVALLTTTICLVISLAVAITTVSIGIARADTFGAASRHGDNTFLAVFFAAVLVGVSALTAAVMRDIRNPTRCDS